MQQISTNPAKSLYPLQVIRKKCLWCMVDSSKEISLCAVGNCTLYEYRSGHKPKNPINKTLKAIRLKCLECSSDNIAERKNCDRNECSLWPFRMGHNPKLKGKTNKGSFIKKTMVQPHS